tara:strand:- start:15586 stop:16296 length:711 start_codon:yes stop_codon:yes gene_type:complete
MNSVFHPSDSRGHANHGWLNTYHSFSFASWHNPERMHFGALRVLNDDAVGRNAGFGTHPHENMEIVSIPLSGSLEHRDSMGNATVIREGDIQIMSAGNGIMHSEKNHSSAEEVHFLQIWVFPNERNLSPSYGQITTSREEQMNKLQCVVSPDGREGVQIHQRAWICMGHLSSGWRDNYAMHDEGQGLYVMVLDGEAVVGGQTLLRRDAIGIWDTQNVQIESRQNAHILAIEVPMQW